jgi:hypothetical protein
VADFYQFVANVGVPAGLAVLVLWRLEQRMIAVEHAIRDLHSAMLALIKEH